MSRRAGWLAVCSMLPWLACAQVMAPSRFEKVEKEYSFVSGTVPSAGWQGGPIVVVLSRDAPPGDPHPTDFQLLYRPGEYWFYARPGSYELAAYETPKGDRDLFYEPGEPAVRYAAGPLIVEPGERYAVDLGERFSTSSKLPPRFVLSRPSGTTRLQKAWRHLGEVVSLDDPRLSLETGRKGLVAADEFVDKIEVGLYFLEEYDPAKVPVLFLHGLGGAPVQFETILAGLDRERFQPWLFSYPSIFPVGLVGRVVNDMMNVLLELHGFPRAHVVAHSLGGLVGRAYIREYVHNSRGAYLDRFVSIATPWGGQAAARLYAGLKVEEGGDASRATLQGDPATDPKTQGYVSWVDLAPGSGFLETLFDEPLPRGVHSYLIFGYGGPPAALEPGDGVVPLESLLRPEAQREASGQRGYDASHMGLLESPEVVAYVQEILEAGAP